MQVISDVHLALDALRAVVSSGDPLLVLGDLVNLIDYRTGDGAIADVMGNGFANETAAARARGDFSTMRALWDSAVGDRLEEVREQIGDSIARQYDAVAEALTGATGYVIHGNVDRPRLLEKCLPDRMEYVHGETREIDGLLFGFAGGGIETPLAADGEVTDAEMEAILTRIGEVDVLCTHVPPAVEALRTDVITGRAERGSQPVLDYLLAHQPRLHLFGDVHQPQASRWRVGRTLCQNVGYFRATGRSLDVRSLLSD